MEDKFKELLDTYEKYIINNEMTGYYYFNIYIIKEYIFRFNIFLEKNKEYENETYLYFKCIYYYCNNEYNIYNSNNKINKLYDILKDNQHYLNLIGYLNYVYRKYDIMKKYYLMTIELNNLPAMNHLGHYYEYIEKNYDLMKKYYLMAIELNSPNAMNRLGYHYHFNEINYDLMKKYYLMAINLNFACSMHNLGFYYHYIEKNYDLTKKYYVMAINFKYIDSTEHFKDYCLTVENNESNYYKYLYFPRILTLILCNKKCKTKLFLPEELLKNIIFCEHMQF